MGAGWVVWLGCMAVLKRHLCCRGCYRQIYPAEPQCLPFGTQCLGHLEDHGDKTESQVLEQLEQHESQVAPVLRHYKASLDWDCVVPGIWRGPAGSVLGSKAAAWFSCMV